MRVLALRLSCLVALATPAMAHHSFVAEYDIEQPVSLTGTITRVEWQNPHIWFFFDVTTDDGTVVNWACSGGAPGQLMRRGIYKSVLPIGLTIQVEGFRARDGSNNAGCRRVTLPDGTNVFTAGNEQR